MKICESVWNDFKRIDFEFEGSNAILISPDNEAEGKKWLFKTEYFGAFPEFEIEMVRRGYYLAHVKNTSRWGLSKDTERQARFAKFLSEEWGLAKQCMPVGMSCGGMQAVYLAAKHPELVAAMYIDAPVLNFLSCPFAVGDAKEDIYDEFTKATGMTVSDLINYRQHPIDYVDRLLDAKIPIFLIAGDSDTVVPYHENGKYLAEKYANSGIFYEIVKKGCDHHPHGLEDNQALVDFTLKYY